MAEENKQYISRIQIGDTIYYVKDLEAAEFKAVQFIEWEENDQ